MTRRALLASVALAATLVGGPPASAAQAGPVTITNCGTELTFETPPTRVLSFYPSMTELVIAIGASDRLVGQFNTSQGGVLPEYQDAFDSVKMLGGDDTYVYPAEEVVLDAQPDLIVAEGPWYFDGEHGPTIPELAKLGIPVYLSEAFCSGTLKDGKITDAFTDIANLGQILGVTDAADTLLASEQEQLDAVTAKLEGVPPLRAVLASFFDDTFYTEGGGLYNELLRYAGATNLFGDSSHGDGPTSVEAVLRADPDVIIYGYETEESRTETLAYILENFPELSAVRNDQIFSTRRTAFAGGLQTLARAEALAAELHPDLFDS